MRANLTSNLSIASTCDGIEEAKQRLNVASSNYLNAITTKTPSGGFYRKKIVSECRRGKCLIISLNRFDKRYLPNHPDADSAGYVKFPEVDKEQELKVVSKMAQKLKYFAHKKICQSKLLVHKKDHNVILIKYQDDPMIDNFVFRDDHLLSWTIRSPFGKNTITFN